MAVAIYVLQGSVALSACGNPDGIEIARTDERSRRIFLVAPPSTIGEKEHVSRLVRRMRVFMRECHGAWGDSWSLSVFSEGKYAGYKDEDGIISYARDGTWQSNYWGEYQNDTRRIVVYPLDQRRRVKIEFKDRE
jgi:hypothetical protein